MSHAMKRGDTVWVFPRHALRRGVPARVETTCENHTLLLVLGEQKPPTGRKKWRNGFLVHPTLGWVLALSRTSKTRPYWMDLFTGTEYGVSTSSILERLG